MTVMKKMSGLAVVASAVVALSACVTTKAGQPPADPADYIGKSDRHQAAYVDCLMRHAVLAHAKAGQARIDRDAVKAQCAVEQGEFYKAAWANTFHGRRDNIQDSWRVATAERAIDIVDEEVLGEIERQWGLWTSERNS